MNAEYKEAILETTEEPRVVSMSGTQLPTKKPKNKNLP